MNAAQSPGAGSRKNHSLRFIGRCVQFLATCWLFAGAAVAQTHPSLIDNFASDTALNTALWTSVATDYLKSAALSGEGGRQCFSLTNNFARPNLSFGPGGMQMSGVNGWNQFTGIQSLNTFAPPFTFETTVTGTVANGNPFEIYFMSADGKQMFSMYGDVNPANVPYVGIKIGCHVIYATPNVNVPYTIDISATAEGVFGVALRSGSTTLTTQTFQMASGPPYGPFYLILGQGEGWPNTGKTENVAIWQSVALQPTAGSKPSPLPAGTYFFKCASYPGSDASNCAPIGSSLFTAQDNARAEQLVKSIVNQGVGLSSCAGLPGALSDFTSKATQALQHLNSGKGTMIYFMYPGGSVTLSVDAAWGPAASAAWTAYDALQLGKGIGGCLVTLAEGSPAGLALEGLTAGFAVYISTRRAYTLQVTPSPIRSAGGLGTSAQVAVYIQATSIWQYLAPLFQQCSAFTAHTISTPSGTCPAGIVGAPVLVQFSSSVGGTASYSGTIACPNLGSPQPLSGSPTLLYSCTSGVLQLTYSTAPSKPKAVLTYQPIISPDAPPSCHTLGNTTLSTKCETPVWVSPVDIITAAGGESDVPTVSTSYAYLAHPEPMLPSP